MRGKAHSPRTAFTKAPPPAGDRHLHAVAGIVLAGADALDRLAGVIEYTEPLTAEEAVIFAATVKRWPHIADVLEIARGDTNEKEKR